MRCALLLSLLALSIGQRRPTLQDLYESLHTRTPIWILQQSYPPQIHQKLVKCIKFIETYLTMKEYNFVRWYRIGDNERHEEFYGSLWKPKSWELGPVLATYKDPVKGKGRRYTLLYWNAEERCSVFQTRVLGRPECEMHVWNKTVNSPLPMCKRFYKSSCAQRKYQVYYKECQHTPKK
ncbi:uncharacterized protein LOC144153049 [Haemaphysalis longicornis]